MLLLLSSNLIDLSIKSLYYISYVYFGSDGPADILSVVLWIHTYYILTRDNG